ncbi:MAG: Ig-like domain-containing protein [Myxococcaceae bacterium]
MSTTVTAAASSDAAAAAEAQRRAAEAAARRAEAARAAAAQKAEAARAQAEKAQAAQAEAVSRRGDVQATRAQLDQPEVKPELRQTLRDRLGEQERAYSDARRTAVEETNKARQMLEAATLSSRADGAAEKAGAPAPFACAADKFTQVESKNRQTFDKLFGPSAGNRAAERAVGGLAAVNQKAEKAQSDATSKKAVALYNAELKASGKNSKEWSYQDAADFNEQLATLAERHADDPDLVKSMMTMAGAQLTRSAELLGQASYEDVTDESVEALTASLSRLGNAVDEDAAAQLSTTSGAVSVTVTAPPPPNQPPAVSLTGPVNGATFTAPANISLSAAASDQDGSVARVEFFAGGTKLGEDLTSPYSLAWSNVAAGSYTLTARATDNQGAATTSAAVNITVAGPTPNLPPGVSLTAPADGAAFTAPATITLAANASDADGSVARVEFFSGATRLGEDLTSPYSLVWSNVPAGSYLLTARATDNQGASTTSVARQITVSEPPVVDAGTPETDAGEPNAGVPEVDAGTPGKKPCNSKSKGKHCRELTLDFQPPAPVLVEDWDEVAEASQALGEEAPPQAGCSATAASPLLLLAAAGLGVALLRS